jgi:hypothetical protein
MYFVSVFLLLFVYTYPHTILLRIKNLRPSMIYKYNGSIISNSHVLKFFIIAELLLVWCISPFIITMFIIMLLKYFLFRGMLLQTSMESVHITTEVESSNPAQARCTRYNIIWWSLSASCDRSVNFSGEGL